MRSRALEGLADGTHGELGIEAAPRIESHLAREYRAVMETISRHQSSRIEVCRFPTEAVRIVGIVRVHGPPVRSEADYADVHASNPAVSIPRTARVWAIRSGPRR